jgi:hypothetical protein
MRLLTHNVLNNNSPSAKGNGYPLRLISVTSIRVDHTNSSTLEYDKNDAQNIHQDTNDGIQVEFVKGIIPTLHWPALVQVSQSVFSFLQSLVMQERE